ncbi:DUF952 domain-containing protein [Deinococcus radiodurans]|uniref:DUF952 domain-containing protein n=1 Tax=Deinococcus radiodurans (strain ATCC 13939 / DSM 20539 / JCM 16871 / CCUG 27074 / LMG 4051 / NBRC 15346 / NCIMB 9279 / VKM B-1422 / R1) TaxID=243230 RepID=Q9RXR5_DEIRA|nr:DUF952 domain-containing protein [Deinococcus radiodurans]AAF09825.1 conserved hypothetical protein [Deinococcus radiodurans R1 = ATCC 13939 = DSM 20539]QEM72206.1 DUF952 domain-containing protein [Deinococcus radiodurans]UDK99440.1 DUF952 domain-containing protein [Deinococcus radiodurans R1 = ATCC 13939 = DSM 20539]UTA49857.1 DUF952 domain-containing protein [Deinococcus radiodurans]HCE65485.1 DUF952 domain-containing protein [Deinococcus radiodurans]
MTHITTPAAWAAAQRAGVYSAPSMEMQGFIHLSAPAQVIGVANFLYAGQSGLLLLVIDPAKLRAELRWEEYEPGSPHFPHLYGPLNLDAVTEVLPFEAGADGRFELPARLRS